MNEQIGNKINDKTYIKLTPFKGFVLENFPFIEADFDAITNYQLLCKVIEYLNNVISNQNTFQELGTDLVNAYNSLVDAVNLAIGEFEDSITADFNTLHDYVYSYFDNLDVQEEINNKLDEMAQDGTLQEIIADYLNSKAVFGFDNVASMKSSTNLINGSYAETLGYYSKNDGGSALYKIRTITNDDVVNEMNIIALSNNTLIAELIHTPDKIDIACLGAKYNDNTSNSSSILQFAVNNYDNIIINGDIYLGSKITINRNYIHIIQNSGKIYPTFNNDDLFRITGYSVKMKVVISGDEQTNDNNVSTTYSAIFVGDGGTEGAEKGRNFDFSYSEINGYYGNGVKHVNGAFGDYSYVTIHNCNGNGFYFPGGCKDNQLHNLAFAHSVNNKGTGYLLTDSTSDNTYTHDNDGVLYPSTFKFNVTKAYGNAQNFYVNCGKHFGSIYSESSTTNHDYWACYRSNITYWAASGETSTFTDAGTDNTFRYVDSWSQPITTNEMFNKLTITSNKIGKQELSQTANNSFNDIVIGDNTNPINVLHTKQQATQRVDSFEVIKINDVKLEVFKNLIVQGPNVTLNAGETYNFRDNAIGQMWISLTTTIPKIFVTAYSPEGVHVGVTASLYARGSSGYTPIELHITNHGSAAINLSDCQFYIVAMN